MQGVYLPIITPFFNDQIDFESYSRLLSHYLSEGVHGIIPLGTTGEVPTIEEDEFRRIIDATVEIVGSKVPIYVGISCNSTAKAVHLIKELNSYPIKGFLVTSPYYNLPSQEGIYRHFRALAGATDHDIVLYNIPYRTGRNIENDTILKLSKIHNITGIKDSCGNIAQTMELIRERTGGFSVMTGEDALYYINLVSGGDGGILASAHVCTQQFLKTCQLVRNNDHQSALKEWNKVSGIVPLLFREPNPSPIKYILARKGLIRSEQVRLPLAPISDTLRKTLDKLIDEQTV